MADLKKLTTTVESQKKWVTQAVDKAEKTKAEKYMADLSKSMEQLATLADAAPLVEQLQYFLAQESQRLTQKVAEYAVQELKKESVTWLKWIDQALEKKNEKTVVDYCNKFRALVDKKRGEAELVQEGRDYVAQLVSYIDKSQGVAGSFGLINEAEKILETCKFKLGWVNKYLAEKQVDKATSMYNELQKAIEPFLADPRYMYLVAVSEFMEQYDLVASGFQVSVDASRTEQQIKKESETIAFHMKTLANELNGQKRLSYIKSYIAKLYSFVSPFAQKFSDDALAAELINEALFLITDANAALDALTIVSEADAILKNARFKLKYLSKCMDEKKITLCTNTFNELQRIMEPLFDSRLIELDSVVQFYTEYEDIAMRYKSEIGLMILEKQIQDHSSKINFLIGTLLSELNGAADLSKIQSYIRQLQTATAPLIQFSGHAPADHLLEQVRDNVSQAQTFVEEKEAFAKAENLAKEGATKLQLVDKYISEKDVEKAVSSFDNVLLLEKRTFDDSVSHFPSIKKLQSDIRALSERVSVELGAIIQQKELDSLHQDIKHNSKWLGQALQTKGRISSVTIYTNKLKKGLNVLSQRFPDKLENNTIVEEARKLVEQANELIEKKKLEEQELLEKAREMKEQNAQEKAEKSTEAARKRMELARLRNEADSCLRASKVTKSIGSSGTSEDDEDEELFVCIEKDSLMPVFDASSSDDKLYSVFMSINRSTDQIFEKYEEFQEVLADLLDTTYIRDEKTATFRLKGLYDKICDSLKAVMFYAPKLKEIAGGKSVYNMLEERVKEAQQIIDEQLDSVNNMIPYNNLINTAKGYMDRIKEDNNSSKCNILSSFTSNLIPQVIPKIQEAAQRNPEKKQECDDLEAEFKQLLVTVQSAQEKLGRELISTKIKERDLTFVEKTIKGLKVILVQEKYEQLCKDIDEERKKLQELIRIEEEKKRIAAEKEAQRLAELKRLCQEEWKGKFTKGGKFQNNDYEVWEYSSNGEVTCTSVKTKSDKMDFFWYGTELTHVNQNTPYHQGYGSWNGARTEWMSRRGLTLYSYIWSSDSNKHLVGAELVGKIAPKEWLWTGKRLVSSHDSWEVIEGEVPHPVILQVAMLKFAPKIVEAYERLEEEARRLKEEKENRVCGGAFAEDPMYMCHSCGFGSARKNCVVCDGAFASIQAKMCHSCSFGRMKCIFCDRTISNTEDGYPAKLCHNCGFGQGARICQMKKK